MLNEKVTYYVVQPFRPMSGRHEGHIACEAIEAPTAASAIERARQFADAGGAGIAFSRTGDPTLGDWEDAVILAQFGPLPPDLEALVA